MSKRWWVVAVLLVAAGCGKKPKKKQAAAEPPPYAVIEVRHGTPEAIRKEVVRHTELTVADKPGRFDVRVFGRGNSVLVVLPARFPPYSFLNLVGWLDLPPETKGVGDATGWYTAPLTGQRLCIGVERENDAGDTVLAADRSGKTYRIYLPAIEMCELDARAEYRTEPSLPASLPPVAVTVEADTVEDFGNPKLAITHPKNTKW